VSWQAASFLCIGVVLVGGFVWYERSRPPSRVIALVAALAALAVAGRVLLAPIPNVVATTDIVLFTGYAIGGAPGFAVGALSALISNMWLGQGPWTPWQMAGWGLVGLGGACLAALTGRRLGRIGLATACGMAGLAYGALLDLSVMVTYGGEQTLDRYLALSVRGIPFNLAHAAGNVVFALVAGPALVRMLQRFRSRLEYRWRDDAPTRPADAPPSRARRGAAVACALAALAVAASLLAAPDAALAKGPGDAQLWLEKAQNSDGGFGESASSTSSPGITGWAILGLESAGRSPLDIGRNGHTPVDYLRKRAGAISSTGDIERTILALEGAGVGSRDFAGQNLVKRLLGRPASDGSFEGQVNLTAFGVLALRAAGESGKAVDRAAKWLRGAQNADGGWGFQPGAGSDPDSTGAALQALAAAGAGGVSDGVGYLRDNQGGDGGWALLGQSSSNSQSTAWAIQGLVAAGTDPGGVKTAGHSGLDYLAARQQGDGHYRYSKSSDQTPVWVTGQGLLAVERKAFPIAAVAQSGGSGSGAGAGSGSFNAVPSPQPSLPPSQPGGLTPPLPNSGSNPFGSGRLPGGLPESELPHGATPTVPGGEIPQPRGGVKGETQTSPPVTAQPSSSPGGDIGGGSNVPFFAIAAAVLVGVAALAFAYDRGPVFGSRPQNPPRTSG
jgi:hypothetical protein